jgi:hypothetical protein
VHGCGPWLDGGDGGPNLTCRWRPWLDRPYSAWRPAQCGKPRPAARGGSAQSIRRPEEKRGLSAVQSTEEKDEGETKFVEQPVNHVKKNKKIREPDIFLQRQYCNFLLSLVAVPSP